MWCGASASTRIHETVRHTWRFDFESSNSLSVVLSSAVRDVELKERCVCLLSFFFSVFCARLSCLSLFWGFVLLLLLLLLYFFFFPSGLVCFISRAIWLVSEPNFAPVSPRSPLPTERHTHIHIFPQTDTLPSHSKQINSSPATV